PGLSSDRRVDHASFELASSPSGSHFCFVSRKQGPSTLYSLGIRAESLIACINLGWVNAECTLEAETGCTLHGFTECFSIRKISNGSNESQWDNSGTAASHDSHDIRNVE